MSEFVTKISSVVRRQFPEFYKESGDAFIDFVGAYYEWLEQSEGVLNHSRSLIEYSSIDTTLSKFIEHFQKEYLYGIPTNIIANKQLLLKHVLDVYRSKGTDRCYKLLFRLIYDQEVDIYHANRDVIKASDGTWVEPRYIEVTRTSHLDSLVGRQVIGSISNTIATVEYYAEEPVSESIVTSVYITGIIPETAEFRVGEYLMDLNNRDAYTLAEAPKVMGSLSEFEIISGGEGFGIGDVLAVAHVNEAKNTRVTCGIDAIIQVSEATEVHGRLKFVTIYGGYGYTQNATTQVAEFPLDYIAFGAYLESGPVADSREITYNTDLLVNYKDLDLNAASYGFPGNPSANASTIFEDYLEFSTNRVGRLYTYTKIQPGLEYQYQPTVLFKSGIESQPLPGNVYWSNLTINGVFAGNVSYDTTSNTVTGVGTSFDTLFSNGDVIYLEANTVSLGTGDRIRILEVIDANTIVLTSPPTHNSTPSAKYSRGFGVEGVGTSFTEVFYPNSMIGLYANDSANVDLQFIHSVANDTFLYIWDNPKYNSESTASYTYSPSIMVAEYADYEEIMNIDGISGLPSLRYGENALVTAIPGNSDKVASKIKAWDSGRGYEEGETVEAFLFNGLQDPSIVSGGSGYVNGQLVTFIGGSPQRDAEGFILTDANGTIISIPLTDRGSFYQTTPEVVIAPTAGSGAIVTVEIQPFDEYNRISSITGTVIKSGIGKKPGYWSTTRGFLNSDKYIHDSYFYQDFSYLLRAENNLVTYRDILYNTFHVAGMELFGNFLAIREVDSTNTILGETIDG